MNPSQVPDSDQTQSCETPHHVDHKKYAEDRIAKGSLVISAGRFPSISPTVPIFNTEILPYLFWPHTDDPSGLIAIMSTSKEVRGTILGILADLDKSAITVAPPREVIYGEIEQPSDQPEAPPRFVPEYSADDFEFFIGSRWDKPAANWAHVNLFLPSYSITIGDTLLLRRFRGLWYYDGYLMYSVVGINRFKLCAIKYVRFERFRMGFRGAVFDIKGGSLKFKTGCSYVVGMDIHSDELVHACSGAVSTQNYAYVKLTGVLC